MAKKPATAVRPRVRTPEPSTRTAVFYVRLSAREKERLDAAARTVGLQAGTWARMTLLLEAQSLEWKASGREDLAKTKGGK